MIQTYKQKRVELDSGLLAFGYVFFQAIVNITMLSIFRLFGLRKEQIKIRHTEIFLVATTLILIALIVLYQFNHPVLLGWIIVILGNIRILQVLSINLLTLMFDYTPTVDKDAYVKRTRLHLAAIAFSFTDVVLAFAFMYQFFDDRYRIMNQHFNEYISYMYYTIVTIATVGYGDIVPVTVFGRMIAIYEIGIGLCIIIYFVSAITGRFQRYQ